MSASLIVANSVVTDVTLIAKRPYIKWPTVIPFGILYLIALYVVMSPEEIWGPQQYLLNQSHIDFLHAALIPLVLFAHGFTSFFTVWSVNFKVKCLFDKLTVKELKEASHVFVHTATHKGDSQIVPLETEKAQPGAQRSQIINGNVYFFNFQQRKWIFDSDKKQFVKPVFPDQLAFATYVKTEGFSGQQALTTAINSFGLNVLPMEVPEFMPLLVDHMFQPFFVFQMFCVLLWCLDEYWMYSVFTGFMMFMMEGTVVFQRIRNMKSLREMGQVPIIPVIVKRNGQWKKVSSDQLLPMDLLVVPNNTHCPADCVLVSGTCVMNEAMLTGESTPQLKEAVPNEADLYLDSRRDTRNMLFGGTQVLLSTGDTSVPDHNIKSAALAVVLRTGFETKQGKLLRTILHSQGRISENSGEAFAFIGILVIFALMASGYLLKRGLADPTKDRWKLFLHCTQIITSVVPTELPMELSLAVNASLVALMKMRVFCTEPFRIPFAGRLDTCCFDKTGTITTDEMLFSGVDMGDGKGLRFKNDDIPKTSEQVLAGCHALVHLEESEVAGDAMEKAAVTALGYKCTTNDVVVKEEPESKDANKPVADANNTAAAAPKKILVSYTIAARFPFSSVLRRMSTVIVNGDERVVVCKGSPEGLKDLCGKTVPADYDAIYQGYASKGLRVIALAHKKVPNAYKSKADIANMTRDEAESDLTFAGFAVFNCPLKKDAEETIRDLIGGSHRCVIITGDNIQTALAVGRMVGIAPCKRHMIARSTVAHGGKKVSGAKGTYPVRLFDSNAIGTIASSPTSASEEQSNPQRDGFEMTTEDVLYQSYTPKQLHKSTAQQRAADCEKKFDLCVDADGMSAEEFAAVVKASAQVVSVWARCNPTQKEDVISHLKALGHCVLMAGDGTNDVGGLKQANVGVAVLNANAMEQAKKEVDKRRADHAAANPHLVAQREADQNDPTLPPIPPGFNLIPMPPPLGPNAGFMDNVRHQTQIAQRKAQIAHFERLDKANKAKKAQADAGAGKAVATTNNSGKADPTVVDNSFATFMAGGLDAKDASFSSLMESAFNSDFEDDQNTMVKLGDASIAAPFTAKSKRLMAVVDIVRNGRSTLVTTLQMYKILALNCLVTAYSMSVLHSDGVKMGDKQMMVTGVIMTICFLTMSRCKPVDRLSSQRPVTKVFHPATIISIFGQFALHLYSLMTAVQMVLDSDKEAIKNARDDFENVDFKPSLLNSIVFLVQTTMTATTFYVNYRGEPFMQSIRKNKPMFFALIALVAIVFYLALEVDPEMNEYFQVVPMPSEEFKTQFVQLLLVDMIGAFVIEKGCLKLLTDG